ncbi:hypothetical protein [Desulfobacter latus]|uniref:hypothetical protein n=1 Tax=Desulfobacter latus TaxID=2292 RepID=UPI001FEBEC81|nr:hypothetical protein [Desulfobacter latus]
MSEKRNIMDSLLGTDGSTRELDGLIYRSSADEGEYRLSEAVSELPWTSIQGKYVSPCFHAQNGKYCC